MPQIAGNSGTRIPRFAVRPGAPEQGVVPQRAAQAVDVGAKVGRMRVARLLRRDVDPRPLYGLPDMATGRHVMVCEGVGCTPPGNGEDRHFLGVVAEGENRLNGVTVDRGS